MPTPNECRPTESLPVLSLELESWTGGGSWLFYFSWHRCRVKYWQTATHTRELLFSASTTKIATVDGYQTHTTSSSAAECHWGTKDFYGACTPHPTLQCNATWCVKTTTARNNEDIANAPRWSPSDIHFMMLAPLQINPCKEKNSVYQMLALGYPALPIFIVVAVRALHRWPTESSSPAYLRQLQDGGPFYRPPTAPVLHCPSPFFVSEFSHFIPPWS